MVWFFFIECISGLYGNECNFNCSQFCHEQLCYQTTGECVHGCEDGYIGGLCKTRNIPAVIMLLRSFKCTICNQWILLILKSKHDWLVLSMYFHGEYDSVTIVWQWDKNSFINSK